MFTGDGVARLEGGQWTALPRDEEFTSASGWVTAGNLGVVAEDDTMWSVLGRPTAVEGEPAELTAQVFDGVGWRSWGPGEAPPEWAEAAQLSQAFPYHLAAASDQHLFVANPQAVKWFSEDGTVARMGSADGLPPGKITTVATAGDGTLWIAATRGLARFNPTAGE